MQIRKTEQIDQFYTSYLFYVSVLTHGKMEAKVKLCTFKWSTGRSSSTLNSVQYYLYSAKSQQGLAQSRLCQGARSLTQHFQFFVYMILSVALCRCSKFKFIQFSLEFSSFMSLSFFVFLFHVFFSLCHPCVSCKSLSCPLCICFPSHVSVYSLYISCWFSSLPLDSASQSCLCFVSLTCSHVSPLHLCLLFPVSVTSLCVPVSVCVFAYFCFILTFTCSVFSVFSFASLVLLFLMHSCCFPMCFHFPRHSSVYTLSLSSSALCWIVC